MGEDTFRDQPLEGLGKVLRGKRRESLDGEGARALRGQEAEGQLQGALKALGWNEADVVAGAKRSTRKQVMAWWLRSRTVVGRRWIAERLRMGHDSRVAWAVGAVRKAKSGELAR